MTYMTLAQRIELELGKREPSEIVELNLDNSKASDVEGLSDDFVNLEVLSLANVGLQNLANLPNLPSLRTLELSNNLIAGGLESLLSCPNLEQLNLSNNKIESFESLTPLVKLSCLKSLDLVNCPVTTVENYRKKAFAMFGELKYLDGLDENEEEEPAGEDAANGETGDNDEVDEADEDEEGSDVEDEDDGEDEIGIEALQRSGDLEDDEEDYAPGEDEEAELDDYDDVDDEDEDDEVEEDTGANLSAAGVTGPRRPAAKRRHEDEDAENGDDEDVVCAAKHKPADGVDDPIKNGSTVE